MSEEKFVPDKLMCDDQTVLPEDVRYYDVKEDPFRVYGLYNYKNESVFKRLPDEIGLNTNDGVAQLYLHTAGGRVRFSTDSDYVIIRAYMPKIGRHNHMPLTGGAGFDLYEDNPAIGDSVYIGTFRPPYDMTDGYVSLFNFREGKKLRHLTINFPTYSQVAKLEIGVQKGACVGEGMAYRNKKPFVFYGSSITQGGCASRPGNNYISLVCRRLNLDYINLGFSGSGKAEDLIVDYMANMEMSAFISDYDHNAPNVEHLQATHCKMYKKIREKNPTIPYVMMSRPDFGGHGRVADGCARRNVIIDTFRYAREQGDQKVYYIDGESYFHGQWEDACTVDRTHPNDMGFMFMADKVFATLRHFEFE
ncbi:MAG: hypothetical protein IKA76_06715 [Clostridia bacterium]|nr:hypothetical protein [Clostridia bacterium]